MERPVPIGYRTDRILLQRECEIAPKLLHFYAAGDTWPKLTLDAEEPTDGFEYRRLESNNGVEVFFAGRRFYIDPHPNDPMWERPGRKHLMFLSFKGFLDAFSDYVQAIKTAAHSAYVSLYAPWALWELLYKEDPAEFSIWRCMQEDTVPMAVEPRENYIFGFESVLDLSSASENPDRVPGLFEGVRVHLSFAVARDQPALQVAFACNGRSLIIQPPGALGAADVHPSVVPGVTAANHLLETVEHAVRRYCFGDEQLRVALKDRLETYEFWRHGQLPSKKGNAIPLHSLTRVLTIPEIDALDTDRRWRKVQGLKGDPIQAIAKTTIVREPPGHHHACSATDLSRLEIGAKTPVPSPIDLFKDAGVVVCIACGRPAAYSARRPELVGPTRTVPYIGADQLERPITLLEWQLRGAANFAKELKMESIRVVLVTTPDIDVEVRKMLNEIALSYNEAAAVWHMDRFEGALLNVTISRQQLLAVCHAGDAAWRLHYNGHFEMLRALLRADGISDCKYALAFSHNNLGVFGEVILGNGNSCPGFKQSADYLRRFAVSEKDAAVECFELKIGKEHRWNELSYFASLDGSDAVLLALVKNIWSHTGVRRDSEERAYFSSNSWYFNLHNLANSITDLPFSSFGHEGRNGEPIDQLTWPGLAENPIQFGAFVHHLTDTAAEETCGFHTHPRFTVILEDTQFEGLPNFKDLAINTKPIKITYPGGRVYPLIGVNKRNVWGGRSIAERKKLPNEEWIGEVWEVSTHLGGPSMILDEDGSRRPLQQEVGNVPYMGKLMECVESLSVQIHPPKRAIEHLRQEGSLPHDNDEPKEEAFYAIATARTYDAERARAHVVFGFNRIQFDSWIEQALPWLSIRLIPDDSSHKLVDALIACVHSRLYQGLARELFASGVDENCPDKLADQLRKTLNTKEHRELLERAIEFYVDEHGSTGAAYPVVGAAFIVGLMALWNYCRDGNPDLRQRLREHCESCQGGVGLTDSPLFRFFNTVQISPGQWLRVPPGTPHAVQGGGNLFIEMSNRSDYTYRILDVGREYAEDPARRRPLHFENAVFCLTEHAFQDPSRPSSSEVNPYVVNTPSATVGRDEDEDFVPCHKDLLARVHEYRSQGASSQIETSKLTFFFNLGGDIRVDTEDKSFSIGPFATFLATPGAKLTLHLASAADRVLEVRERDGQPPLAICYAPTYQGGPRIPDIVVVDPSTNPAFRQVPSKHPFDNWSDLTASVAVQSVESRDRSNSCVKLLSFPGHVRPKEYAKVFSLAPDSHASPDFHNRTEQLADGADLALGDAQANALGEHYHPMGRLASAESGIILHPGGGFCVGIWDRPLTKQPNHHLGTLAAIGAIGRWLYIDPQSNHTFFRNRNSTDDDHAADQILRSIEEWAFPPSSEAVPDMIKIGPRSVLRLSVWLSSDAIALRSAGAILGEEDCGRIFKAWPGRTYHSSGIGTFLDVYKANRGNIDHQAVFRKVFEAGALPQARQCFIRIGWEFAQVVRVLRTVLRRNYREDFLGDAVVLSGVVGERLGWVRQSGRDAEIEDVLIESIRTSLQRSRSQRRQVWRSAVGSTAVLSAAGLAGFYNKGRVF